MCIAGERGRATCPEIKLGIWGDQGGDPDSVKFCHKLGLNHVSCSLLRVPVAQLTPIDENRAAPRQSAS